MKAENGGNPGAPKKTCGFCGTKVRSQKQRNRHTNRCKK